MPLVQPILEIYIFFVELPQGHCNLMVTILLLNFDFSFALAEIHEFLRGHIGIHNSDSRLLFG